MDRQKERVQARIILAVLCVVGLGYFGYRSIIDSADRKVYRRAPLCEPFEYSQLTSGRCRADSESATVVNAYLTSGRRSRALVELKVDFGGQTLLYVTQVNDRNFWSSLYRKQKVRVDLWRGKVMRITTDSKSAPTSDDVNNQVNTDLLLILLIAGFWAFFEIMLRLASRKQNKAIAP